MKEQPSNRNIRSISVFCGSSVGNESFLSETAKHVGETLALNGIRVIYGGARIGLMGAVADGALHKNGKVTGVIPHFLRTKEVAHANLTELILVDTMHERKMKMHDLCDGFIALPGGFGTMEEIFEMITWAQLGLHNKPVGLLNVNGFYDALVSLVSNMVHFGLLKEENQRMLLVANDISDLLRKMADYVPPDIPKWITEKRT